MDLPPEVTGYVQRFQLSIVDQYNYVLAGADAYPLKQRLYQLCQRLFQSFWGAPFPPFAANVVSIEGTRFFLNGMGIQGRIVGRELSLRCKTEEALALVTVDEHEYIVKSQEEYRDANDRFITVARRVERFTTYVTVTRDGVKRATFQYDEDGSVYELDVFSADGTLEVDHRMMYYTEDSRYVTTVVSAEMKEFLNKGWGPLLLDEDSPFYFVFNPQSWIESILGDQED